MAISEEDLEELELVDMEVASLRQQVKELKGRIESGMAAYSAECAARDWLAREKERVEKQRDEARELVRRYVDAEMDPTDEDGDGRRRAFLASQRYVARWDEEEKKR